MYINIYKNIIHNNCKVGKLKCSSTDEQIKKMWSINLFPESDCLAVVLSHTGGKPLCIQEGWACNVIFLQAADLQCDTL